MKEEVTNTVNHPSHYNTGKYEVIDVIEDALTKEEYYGFCRGNCLKYLLRAGHKGDLVTDLEKCDWYLREAIRAKSGKPREDKNG